MNVGSVVTEAYDSIAKGYDSMLEGDAWMREILWSQYERLFQPGQQVLDVGAGTGADAIFLARRGISVCAIDISPAMIGELLRRVELLGLGHRVHARILDLAELSSCAPASFDGLVSAFAGLSTTSDLAKFAECAAVSLRPRGHMVLHMLNRFSLWEWLGYLRRRDWVAAKGLRKVAERDFDIGGQVVRHYLYGPYEAYRRFFAPHFRVCQAIGMGILLPPHTVRRVPSPGLTVLSWLERRVASRHPFVNWGRFFLLDLEKRQAAG